MFDFEKYVETLEINKCLKDFEELEKVKEIYISTLVVSELWGKYMGQFSSGSMEKIPKIEIEKEVENILLNTIYDSLKIGYVLGYREKLFNDNLKELEKGGKNDG